LEIVFGKHNLIIFEEKIMWHQYLLGILFVVAGANHFRQPKLYLKIIPNAFPNKNAINIWAGILEIVFGGLLLFEATKILAAYGIIGLLVAFFATHFFMIQNQNASLGLPKWFLYLRLLLQFGLIYWAFQYTKS
jgi:uncharacterized membrane protein